MNDILAKLARLSDGVEGEAEGVDVLFLDAVHFRAFIYAIDATENEEFIKSFLCQSLVIGSTYSIVLKTSKLYERKKNYEINSLRELWKKLDLPGNEAKLITQELNTNNSASIFSPIIDFRDKTLGHNEIRMNITWTQIDRVLLFYARVWHLVGQHSDSMMMFPFFKFRDVSAKLDSIFNKEQLRKAEMAWGEYIERIKKAVNTPYSL